MGDVSRRRPVLLDAAAAVGFALLPHLSVARPDTAGAVGGLTAGLLTLATALPLTVRWLWPVPVFAVVLTASCAALAAGLGPAVLLATAYALYPVATTRRRQPGRSAVIAGGASAVGAALLAVTGGQAYEGGTLAVHLLSGLLLLGATWAAGTAVRERRESLRRTIEQAAEQARAEERLRIARDLHDVVTHSVGLIAVRAGVANHVAATRPEEARAALAVIEDVSRGALRDLRATLKVLRREEGEDEREQRDGERELRPVRGLADLPSLARTAEAAGVRVGLRSDCAEEPPDGVALAAYRIAQEALTNVVKHAAPTRCVVHVTAAAGVLTVDVADDGPGPGRRASVPGGGMGLTGMAERAAAHGGTLTAGPSPGAGFRVVATLPY